MPFVTYFCIISCFANFLRELSIMRSDGRETALVDSGAMYPPYVHELHQYWRLVTAGFVHMSWWHLLMNMYVLWELGAGMENGLGHGRYALLLAGAIVTGNLLSCYMGDNDRTISAGMSTGLYGLMAFEIVFLAGAYGWEAVLQNHSILYTIFVNVLMNFLPGVGWKGHLGGACWGILFAVVFLKVRGF